MTPLYFGDGLFGWLHAAKSPSKIGLVLVNPFGYEAICAHRSLRHFAEAAAGAGIPALRFDHHGTGDSAGSDRDPARLEAWLKSLDDAADALRRHAGVERIVFLGVRLGALLATLAATRRDDCEGLITIAPVISGKAHLRELRALQMALGLKEPPPGTPKDESAQEALGFHISAETKDALSKQDLLKLEKAPPSVLILDREDLPSGEKWAERLASLGARVDRRILPGYVEMVLDPHKAVVPQKMVEAIVDWLKPQPSEAKVVEAPAQITQIDGIEERAVSIDSELFGIYSTQAAHKPRRRGILLLNAGSVYRVGPNRLYVALARRWAKLGHAVLRFDLSGIGDSQPRTGAPENVVYTPNALRDLRAAVSWLRAQPGVTEVAALGLCSGAYNAFKGAVAGLDLDSIVCINPLTFFFKPGMPLDYAAFAVIYEARRYNQAAKNPQAWKKLLRGQVRLDLVWKVMSARLRDLAEGRARDLARRLRIPLTDDLGQELEKIADHGIRLRFLFAGGEPGIDLLRDGGGSSVTRLQKKGQLAIEIIDGPDHTFTPLWSHAAFENALARHFDGAV